MADTKISALTASTTPLTGAEVLPIVQSGVTKQVSIANVTAGRSVAALSVITPTIQAETGSAGGTIKNGSGVAQMQWGSGGGSNLSMEVATNINPANAAVNISPTGTGTVTISPAGALTINPTAASTINNTSIGATTASTGRFTSVTATTGNFVVGTSGQGIDFSATPGTGTSELLSDYEEGTITPIITGGATGVSYTTQSGNYTRIGNMVFFRLNLVMSAATANGSAFKVGGLPFTCGASGGGSFAYDNGAWTGSASTNMPMVFIGAGGTEITFFQGSGAQVVGTDLVSIGADNFYIVGQYTV